jgi:hypothetical protein
MNKACYKSRNKQGIYSRSTYSLKPWRIRMPEKGTKILQVCSIADCPEYDAKKAGQVRSWLSGLKIRLAHFGACCCQFSPDIANNPAFKAVQQQNGVRVLKLNTAQH